MEPKRKTYEIDMCTGALLPKILLFTLPLMASSILQLLFNAADIIVVGRFAGDAALAAVGANTALINLLVNFFMGLSIGANVLVARYYAGNQKRDLDDVVHTAMTVSIISGIILNAIGVIFARQILIWMATPNEVLPLAVIYLRIYFFGMIAMMVYNFGAAILRAVGDTRRPLYYLIFAGVVNVLLNLLFVILFHMSVAGVGLATVISQCISGGLVLRCLIRADGSIALDLRRLRINRAQFGRILRIGIPAGFQGMLFSISNVIIQSTINSFGTIVVAGSSAAANIEGFVYVAMNAFHQAALSFTGQNYGAGKKERIIKILLWSELCVFVTGTLLGRLACFFGHPLLGLYSRSEDVIAAGMIRLLYICGVYALCGMMDVSVGVLRGLGYSIGPMFITLIGVCGLRLFWIFTFFRWPMFHSIENLYMTYPVTWTITIIANLIYLAIVWKKIKKA